LPAHSDFRARTHPGTQKPAVPVPREEKQGPTIPPSGQARTSPSPLETDESHALAHRPTGPATSGPADQCLRPDVTPVARGIPREVKSARGHHTPFPSCPHRARQAPRAPAPRDAHWLPGPARVTWRDQEDAGCLSPTVSGIPSAAPAVARQQRIRVPRITRR
jgi:hypothetical protein